MDVAFRRLISALGKAGCRSIDRGYARWQRCHLGPSNVSKAAFLLALLWLPLELHAVSPLKTDYRGATVYRDENFNGQLDEAEKGNAVTTDDNGRCPIPKGKKGKPLILIKGEDINTGLPNNLSILAAPPKAKSIGTLTALWQALLTRDVKPQKAKKALGIKASDSIDQYQAGPASKLNKPSRRLAQVASQQTTLVKFLKSLSLGTARTLSARALSAKPAADGDEVVIARAEELRAKKGQREDLTDAAQVQEILVQSLSRLGSTPDNGTLLTAATIASQLNRQALRNPDQLDVLNAIAGNAADLIRRGSTADYQSLTTYFSTDASLQNQLAGDIYLTYPGDLRTVPARNSAGVLTVDNFSLQGSIPYGTESRPTHVNVYQNGVLQGEALIDTKGGWNLNVAVPTDGQYTYVARGVNSLGHEGAESNIFTVTVQTRSPGLPCVAPAPQTRTVACPLGQIGSINQERDATCPTTTGNPVWGDWTDINTACRTVLEPEMVRMPFGKFTMGSPDEEEGRKSDEVQHSVKIFAAFYIGAWEVTQDQWESVMGSNPSYRANCGPKCPVEQVSWLDVQDYIDKLNQATGKHYRLPTEAEWEYACRSGSTAYQTFCGSNDVTSVGWSKENTSTRHPVGQKSNNGAQLFDMSGNVWEWTCSDYNANYATGSESVCATAPSLPVVRGGSDQETKEHLRAARRGTLEPGKRFGNYGFRLVRDE